MAEHVEFVRILRLHGDSRPETLARIRRQVRDALSKTALSEDAVLDMELAAGELLSNVHRHAYPWGIGPVFVEVFRTRRTVTLVVIDRGEAEALPAVPRQPPRHARPGGRGLYLTNTVADEVKFALGPTGHGLAVRVSKWVQPPVTLRRLA